MDYYLLTYQIEDGGHHHYDHIVTEAKDLAHAIRKGMSQEHEAGTETELPRTMFDFGDGETAANFQHAKLISKFLMQQLDELGVVYFYQLSEVN